MVNKLYLSGNFSLHPAHTLVPNTSSHTQSISQLPHSPHVFRSPPSPPITLSPGSNGPSFRRRSPRSSSIRSHSFTLMCAGRPLPASAGCSALLNGSSAAARNPPRVSVIVLKSWSTKLLNLRAASMGGAPSRASRAVDGIVEAYADVEIAACARLRLGSGASAGAAEKPEGVVVGGPAERWVRSCWSRMALALSRFSSWEWCQLSSARRLLLRLDGMGAEGTYDAPGDFGRRWRAVRSG